MGGAIPLHILCDFGVLQSELYFLLVIVLFGGKNYFLSPSVLDLLSSKVV